MTSSTVSYPGGHHTASSGKGLGEGRRHRRKAERWQRCYQGHLVGCLAARLHLRLRIRSMNKGGRLRPTDSEVNADTRCKGRRGGPLRAGNCCSQHPSQSDAALADASLSGTALVFHVCGEVGNVPREIPYNFTGKEAVTRPGSKSQLGLLIRLRYVTCVSGPPCRKGVAPALAGP